MKDKFKYLREEKWLLSQKQVIAALLQQTIEELTQVSVGEIADAMIEIPKQGKIREMDEECLIDEGCVSSDHIFFYTNPETGHQFFANAELHLMQEGEDEELRIRLRELVSALEETYLDSFGEKGQATFLTYLTQVDCEAPDSGQKDIIRMSIAGKGPAAINHELTELGIDGCKASEEEQLETDQSRASLQNRPDEKKMAESLSYALKGLQNKEALAELLVNSVPQFLECNTEEVAQTITWLPKTGKMLELARECSSVTGSVTPLELASAIDPETGEEFMVNWELHRVFDPSQEKELQDRFKILCEALEQETADPEERKSALTYFIAVNDDLEESREGVMVLQLGYSVWLGDVRHSNSLSQTTQFSLPY